MPLAPSWLQLCSRLAYALRSQASLRRAQGLLGCTLTRAPVVRALSEGSEGQKQGSFCGCFAAQTQRHTESTRFQGPLARICSPAHTQATPWVPRKCVTDVGSPPLSSPAETCAGGWGLTLVSGFPPTAPTQGKQPLRQDLLEEPCAPA